VTSPDIHTISGAYALDAVDDIERAAFERHLAECESCALEVSEYRAVAARLADGTWSVPSPRLREQVLARAAATPQLLPAARRRPVPSPVTRWRRAAVAAAAVAVLGIGGAATGVAVQGQRLDDARAASASAQQRAERIQTVLAAPDARLQSGELRGGGRVSLVVSAAQDAGVVTLADAPAPGPDRAYELWVLDGTTPIPVGLLPAGQADATQLVEGVRGRDGFAVSLEPAGGSPVPSTTPLVAVSFL
jgi:anti-sigma-K factor RskA